MAADGLPRHSNASSPYSAQPGNIAALENQSIVHADIGARRSSRACASLAPVVDVRQRVPRLPRLGDDLGVVAVGNTAPRRLGPGTPLLIAAFRLGRRDLEPLHPLRQRPAEPSRDTRRVRFVARLPVREPSRPAGCASVVASGA
jgi:hypothetical protein